VPDNSRRALMEAELRAVAHDLDAQLGEVDLSQAVTRRLAMPSARTRSRERSRRRLLVVALAAGITVTATGAIPSARAAITDFFDIGAVRVHDESPSDARVPVPSPTVVLRLGDRTTLAEVRGQVPVVVPTVDGLQTPDEVWFDDVGGGEVSLVFRARPGLPAAEHTGIGLLVQEFTGDEDGIVQKYLTSDSRARPVAIGSNEGVFLSGGDHYLFYTDPTGAVVYEDGRLVGNALIFQRGPLTIRIEGDLPLRRMATIAASLR
jgi:hypothetical protein